MLTNEIKPGVSTIYLDSLAEEFIRDNGGIPAFLGLYNFPNKKPSAHFEHNIAIINGKPYLLSTYKYIYKSLGFSSKEEELF